MDLQADNADQILQGFQNHKLGWWDEVTVTGEGKTYGYIYLYLRFAISHFQPVDNVAHGQKQKERRKARGMVIKVIVEVINPGAGWRRSEDKQKDKDLEVEDEYNDM